MGAKLHFTSWHATHALTRALFEDGFGVLDWYIPEGRLVPALPNRMNYLMWLADLLSLSYSGLLLVVTLPTPISVPSLTKGDLQLPVQD
jgi:23S rRNA A1618 N6-methylase RlmF